MIVLPLPTGCWTRSHASHFRTGCVEENVGLALTTLQRGLDCASDVRRFGWVRGEDVGMV
ncbi:hypothetical protein PAXRUDRAFT_821223 [Paxillus rubicundulus Ve08.2h10]|uniref:Unplaced genomic scaffold scaffold_3, whole genome shotgun sequence n=1 Tax=Paxillus rubicundulus Ve08.2h10 TaxID=930991 RepID=A0A0D0E6X1_9AGAM|nr:hypothetical protein PAXRUDRAFT_821223 [Paxillus rubicundulus Ve08.2h10]